jgi:hypothetical protein
LGKTLAELPWTFDFSEKKYDQQPHFGEVVLIPRPCDDFAHLLSMIPGIVLAYLVLDHILVFLRCARRTHAPLGSNRQPRVFHFVTSIE